MGESMKIELLEYGLDQVLDDIQNCLEQALKAKSRKKKDILISQAQGIARTIYAMVDVKEEKIETQE